jgi:tetratricopeptide (TPR) repeat protein
MYIDRGDLNAAARECQRMIDLDKNFWAAHQTLAIVSVKQSRYEDALGETQKSIELSNRSNASLALLGHVYGRLGQRSEADAVIKELEKRYADKAADGRDLAVVYAGSGKKDEAFGWLDKAFANHSVILAFLRLEPLLEPLQGDPRWKDLERRIGVDQYTSQRQGRNVIARTNGPGEFETASRQRRMKFALFQASLTRRASAEATLPGHAGPG